MKCGPKPRPCWFCNADWRYGSSEPVIEPDGSPLCDECWAKAYRFHLWLRNVLHDPSVEEECIRLGVT